MTYEEALKRFKQSYELTKDYDNKHWECRERIEHQEWVEQLSAAIEAIEKQIPKKPLITDKSKWLVCPTCFTFIHADNLFCKRCGQALEWRE